MLFYIYLQLLLDCFHPTFQEVPKNYHRAIYHGMAFLNEQNDHNTDRKSPYTSGSRLKLSVHTLSRYRPTHLWLALPPILLDVWHPIRLDLTQLF